MLPHELKSSSEERHYGLYISNIIKFILCLLNYKITLN